NALIMTRSWAIFSISGSICPPHGGVARTCRVPRPTVALATWFHHLGRSLSSPLIFSHGYPDPLPIASRRAPRRPRDPHADREPRRTCADDPAARRPGKE